MSHAYIQTEDLGLTVLGTTQYGYTVNGVHGQDFDTAVYRAALCRNVGLEASLTAYTALLAARQRKLQDLGDALARVNEGVARIDPKDLKTDTDVEIGSAAASALRRYGFDAQKKMKYRDVSKLQQSVQYELDREDNALQQEMTDMQNFISKRDDAMQMATKLMKKVAQTRSRGIRNIGS